MAIKKSRRRHMYDRLVNSGFTRGEAVVFSRVQIDAPYLHLMVKERRDFIQDAKAQGLTDKDIRQKIAGIYKDNDWVKYDILGRVRPDYWSYLRDVIDRGKNRGLEYESPAITKTLRRRSKRVVNRESFQRAKQKAKEKDDQKYPTGGHYKRGR